MFSKTKRQLREEARNMRGHLSSQHRVEAESRIYDNCVRLLKELKPSRVAAYRSYKSEISLDSLFFSRHLDVSWCFPRIEGDKIHFYVAQSVSDFEPNPNGILEPHPNLRQPISEIQLFLVPGLMFDKYGHRLGSGKGYYDKALSESDRAAIKVGVQYKSLVLSTSLPVEEHDVDMNYIITEEYIQSLNTNERLN